MNDDSNGRVTNAVLKQRVDDLYELVREMRADVRLMNELAIDRRLRAVEAKQDSVDKRFRQLYFVLSTAIISLASSAALALFTR